MQGVQRYVIFAYLLGGLLLYATLSKLFKAIAFALNVPDLEILGDQFTVSNALSLVIAAGAAVVAFKNERAYGFSSEVVAELKKVTWPSKQETRTATVVVIITTLILGAILSVFDAVWAAATSWVY